MYMYVHVSTFSQMTKSRVVAIKSLEMQFVYANSNGHIINERKISSLSGGVVRYIASANK